MINKNCWKKKLIHQLVIVVLHTHLGFQIWYFIFVLLLNLQEYSKQNRPGTRFMKLATSLPCNKNRSVLGSINTVWLVRTYIIWRLPKCLRLGEYAAPTELPWFNIGQQVYCCTTIPNCLWQSIFLNNPCLTQKLAAKRLILDMFLIIRINFIVSLLLTQLKSCPKPDKCSALKTSFPWVLYCLLSVVKVQYLSY